MDAAEFESRVQELIVESTGTTASPASLHRSEQTIDELLVSSAK
ncbi:MAG: hypothetical protein ACYS0E_12985 [Planctomycetota bacterium]